MEKHGKISAQPHTTVKQICFPNSNLLFLSLFSLSKNCMNNVVWGCAEILPTKVPFTSRLDSFPACILSVFGLIYPQGRSAYNFKPGNEKTTVKRT